MTTGLPTVACPVCGGGARPVRRLPGDYRLLRCAACGCRFCHPFAAPPPEFYTRAADRASAVRHAGPREWHRSHPTRRSALLQDGRGRRLLDVGCGNGAFAAFAAERGFEVVGLDVDDVSLDIARGRPLAGAQFHRLTLPDYCRQAGGERFDVVTMFEVFEHLDCPVPTVEQVRGRLRDGGAFVGSVPNTARPLMWRLHMDYEMPPFHLTYWTVDTWRSALTRFGFDADTCEASIYYGYISDVLLMRYRLPRPLRALVERVVYPVEYKLESTWKVGASIYFEATRRAA